MRLFLIILFLFTITSCNKSNNENTQTFKGVVFDYSTSARVPYTTIILLRSDGLLPGGDFSNFISDTTVTNANGEYEINVDKVADKTIYKMEAQKPGYSAVDLLCSPRVLAKLLNSNQYTYNDTLLIDKSTFVNTVINNLLPANPNDTLDLSIWRSKTCSGGPIIITEYYRKEKQFIGLISNQYFSDTFSLKATPNVVLKWTVRNNGIISTNEQVMTPVEFGTTTFNLNY